MTDDHRLASVSSASAEGAHTDDRAVDLFAARMKTKLAMAREKGRGGWDDPAQCSVSYLQQLLHEHVAKGDPVDVANFCMMLGHYGASTTPEPVPATNQAGEVERRDVPTVTSDDAYRLRKVAEANCGCRIPAPFDEVADHLAALSFNEGVKRCFATQPATSQEGEEPTCERCDRGVCVNPHYEDDDRLNRPAATPTPPTLSEDLRELVEQEAVDIITDLIGSGAASSGTNCRVVEDHLKQFARAALAQVKAS